MSGPDPRAPSTADLGRLVVRCPDRPGIVAVLSGLMAEAGANITESQQHSSDPSGGTFTLRLEFVLADLATRRAELEAALAGLAGEWRFSWRLTEAARTPRLAVFVSKADHVLQELLYRVDAGDLRAEIAAVVSNHPDLEPVARAHGVPFHHVPVTADTKDAAEARALELIGDVDLVVLARYMQIVSADFCSRFPERLINIHHSFLPAFVGANPYRAAHDRGVKLIGATAHYVTAELDAGPIIEQEVARVDHRATVEDMRRIGRYVERQVLAQAVTWHVEDRVVVEGDRTIVFA
ncbi:MULTISPECIES: formyltetrahydrofolate deformylase [unclassified Modestobacter]|uniref:formyltetrahydrofolate deformylase n=1 Tax=unclassified Modestobacter TaxID=2643866 RepID=UPI0022AA3D74|nr:MULTISPECIES: formyltetrahydrofolate deformylase [unclassified Modestobacter]MCZ2814044.1 formyltetrahydrofolate deformylase [Modestobacter sp. VKM Ac-2979]MCZ2844540.1 formyltetrahydrofolate deformylase [Modestobacter sp. VKM Ac-2980]MCZ2848930.1 formyltetrahydrofolate deformylase [Modestobacter sp. VKM Ac-2978]